MTDIDAALRAQALHTLRSGTEEERRVAAGYLHSEIQELSERLAESAERHIRRMTDEMLDGLERATAVAPIDEKEGDR